jgi:hypothetical protein
MSEISPTMPKARARLSPITIITKEVIMDSITMDLAKLTE